MSNASLPWPTCSHFACKSGARWSIASSEEGDLNSPTVSGFACRRHLSYVLENDQEAMSGMDQCVIIDLLTGNYS